MQAIIRDYGNVDFDPAAFEDNFYELYCVCICVDEQVVAEEHYVDEDEFRAAINDTYGRELMDERIEEGYADVDTGFGTYECEVLYHFAYVIDNEEE